MPAGDQSWHVTYAVRPSAQKADFVTITITTASRRSSFSHVPRTRAEGLSVSQHEFAFITLTSDNQLARRPAGAALSRGEHPVVIVDVMDGTWTGYVPWPYTESDLDAETRETLAETKIGNDLCAAHRARRPVPDPRPVLATG
jgi:hypothetical protein